MKKIIIVLLAVFMLSLSSCEAKDQEYSYNIRDALKISALVLDESIKGDVDWIVDETTMQYVDTVDGVICDGIYVFEQLKLNKVRTLAPLGYRTTRNLSIFIEFDGTIEVETEDELIELSYDVKNPSQPLESRGSSYDGTVIFENVKVPYEVYVSICPLDEYYSGVNIRSDIKKTDREYYLNVNAYNFENEETPVIRAQLKLVVLDDKTLPRHHDSFGSYVGEEMSRFLSIEVISYEYSDRYILLDEIYDEDEEE